MEGAVIIADPNGECYGFVKEVFRYLEKRDGKGFSVTLSDIQRKEFRDGEYKLKISDNVRKKKCFFVHDSNKEATKWLTDLVLTLDAMRFSSPSEIIVVLPYTRFARQDRKDESRVSVNIKAVADIISLYAHRGMTIDLHTPQIQEYFGIPFDNLYSFPVVIDYLIKNHKDFLHDLVVVSPDVGGGKRVEIFQKNLSKEKINSDMCICYKKRVKENEVSEIKIMGDVEGKNCLILDDIIDTGGTLIKTSDALKKNGAKKVFAYGTHGIFSDGVEKFKDMDKILISNSICSKKAENFEVISLTDLFGEAIYRTIVGDSLSGLFE